MRQRKRSKRGSRIERELVRVRKARDHKRDLPSDLGRRIVQGALIEQDDCRRDEP